MQLTRAADYAVRVMIHLARLEPGSRASRGELAIAADCPEQFLAKVLQSLTHAGLVVSHRGNTGGFELPVVRRDATLLDIVEALEGPIRLNTCLGPEECSRKDGCPAYPIWHDAQEALVAVLRRKTIGEMAQSTLVPEPEPVAAV